MMWMRICEAEGCTRPAMHLGTHCPFVPEHRELNRYYKIPKEGEE